MSISNPITDKMSHELDPALEGAVSRTRDPEKMRQIIDKMNRSREEPRQRIGTVSVAVDLIRNARQPMKYVLDASVGLKSVLPE